MSKLIIAIGLVLMWGACSSGEEKVVANQINYFDLKTYFTNTANILNSKQPFVIKAVSKNNIAENRKIKIKDWKTELALFADADINKPAFKNSYAKDSSATKVTYTAKNQDLKTQKIEIDYLNSLPVKFKIQSKTDNLLFHATEELIFVPNAYYNIKKHQKIVLVGENNYLIKGIF